MEIGVGLGLGLRFGWGWGWPGCSLHVRNQRAPEGLAALMGGFSRREVVTSWIFLLTALSMGHSDWPHTSSPRTGMKRKERAFHPQVLQEKNQEISPAGSTSPHPGKLRPTEPWDWELWVPTEDGAETQVCPLQAGAAVTYPLCGLSRPNFEH